MNNLEFVLRNSYIPLILFGYLYYINKVEWLLVVMLAFALLTSINLLSQIGGIIWYYKNKKLKLAEEKLLLKN